MILEVLQKPRRALDCNRAFMNETRLFDLVTEFTGVMKIGGCEVIRVVRGVPVLARFKVAVNDPLKRRVLEKALPQAVEDGRKAGDRNREYEGIRFGDSQRLANCGNAVLRAALGFAAAA